jgi:hypothetical protein
MSSIDDKHRELTVQRIRAFLTLFGAEPSAIYSSVRFSDNENEPNPIDVLVFPLDPERPIVAAVTNGLSDRRMVDESNTEIWIRRELIQYFPACSENHARRLHDMAWAPLLDGLLIDRYYSLAWSLPALAGTPWRHGFFLEPIIRQHRDFRFTIEGDEASLLWHVPISDEEREFKLAHGPNALLDKMAAAKLPWVFDEMNRPPLL